MAIDQLKAFLSELQKNQELLNAIRVAATANEIAEIALGFGYEFSGDELLRFSGKKVGRVTVQKNDVPGEYN